MWWFLKRIDGMPVFTTIILPDHPATTNNDCLLLNRAISAHHLCVEFFIYSLHTTVSAICENGNTYPVGPTDGKIPGTATSVVWDTYGWQQSNANSLLAKATYTLEIFDNRGPGSARSPGLLQPNNALRFALYTLQQYTPISSGRSS